MNRLPAYLLAFHALWLASGCTHMQLRKHTNQQLRTSSDIVQQQVMDSVAKVATDANAWPEFSNLSVCSTELADGGGGSLGLAWDARSITEEALGLTASRQLTESWELAPITDPARLRAMWAAYHYTIYGTTPETPYYSGSLQLREALGPQWQELIPAPGWFQTCTQREYSCHEKVHCGCVVGRYCDTRACVVPGNEAQLQQLTFVIMYLSGVTILNKEGTAEAAFPTGVPPLPLGIVPRGGRRAPGTGAEALPDGGQEALPRTGPAKDFYRPYFGPRSSRF